MLDSRLPAHAGVKMSCSQWAGLPLDLPAENAAFKTSGATS